MYGCMYGFLYRKVQSLDWIPWHGSIYIDCLHHASLRLSYYGCTLKARDIYRCSCYLTVICDSSGRGRPIGGSGLYELHTTWIIRKYLQHMSLRHPQHTTYPVTLKDGQIQVVAIRPGVRFSLGCHRPKYLPGAGPCCIR